MPSAINIAAITGVPLATTSTAGKVMLGTGLSTSVAGALLSTSTVVEITEPAHTHTVGRILTHNGTAFVPAMADSAATAEVVGIVTAVTADTFFLATNGQIDGLTDLTAGSVYFLSADSAGTFTSTEPLVSGQVSKPVFVATATDKAVLINSRGYVV